MSVSPAEKACASPPMNTSKKNNFMTGCNHPNANGLMGEGVQYLMGVCTWFDQEVPWLMGKDVTRVNGGTISNGSTRSIGGDTRLMGSGYHTQFTTGTSAISSLD